MVLTFLYLNLALHNPSNQKLYSTASQIQRMMVTNNLSLTQVKKHTFMERTFHGRKSIEFGCLKKLQEMDYWLQPFFFSTSAEFDSSVKANRFQGIKVKRSIVYCNNLTGLLKFLAFSYREVLC